MAWKTVCEGVSGEEAARFVVDILREKDRQWEEYLRNKGQVSSSITIPTRNELETALVSHELKRREVHGK